MTCNRMPDIIHTQRYVTAAGLGQLALVEKDTVCDQWSFIAFPKDANDNHGNMLFATLQESIERLEKRKQMFAEQIPRESLY